VADRLRIAVPTSTKAKERFLQLVVLRTSEVATAKPAFADAVRDVARSAGTGLTIAAALEPLALQLVPAATTCAAAECLYCEDIRALHA